MNVKQTVCKIKLCSHDTAKCGILHEHAQKCVRQRAYYVRFVYNGWNALHISTEAKVSGMQKTETNKIDFSQQHRGHQCHFLLTC